MADKNNARLEERLAEFTDRLLAGEAPERPDASGSNRELEVLQETVRHAREALMVEPPGAELRNRIRGRLSAEWHRSGPPAVEGKKVWASSRREKQVLFLRFAASAAVVLILIGFLAPKTGSGLSGAAWNGDALLLLLGGLLLVLVLILLWFTRKP